MKLKRTQNYLLPVVILSTFTLNVSAVIRKPAVINSGFSISKKLLINPERAAYRELDKLGAPGTKDEFLKSLLDPTFENFSPKKGKSGILLTITGINLKDLTSFKIAGADAAVFSNTGAKLVGMIIKQTKRGPVEINTINGKVKSAASFGLPNGTVYALGGIISGINMIGATSMGSRCAVPLGKDGKTAVAGAQLP